MILFVSRRDAPAGGPPGELPRFASDLERDGKLRRAAPLHPEWEGARVRVRDGRAVVTDGPFPESKEALVGFWLVDVPSRAEAIAIARRAYELGEPRPIARRGAIEVHLCRARRIVPDPGKGLAFLFAFRMEPGLVDPDGSKLREMLAFSEGLEREGKFVETAPLAKDPPHARVEARSGEIVVTDGPFTETKEVVGGYSLVRAESRAEAIEIARRYPHAKWGPVEVRQLR
jgi:hypothetical protein